MAKDSIVQKSLGFLNNTAVIIGGTPAAFAALLSASLEFRRLSVLVYVVADLMIVSMCLWCLIGVLHLIDRKRRLKALEPQWGLNIGAVLLKRDTMLMEHEWKVDVFLMNMLNIPLKIRVIRMSVRLQNSEKHLSGHSHRTRVLFPGNGTWWGVNDFPRGSIDPNIHLRGSLEIEVEYGKIDSDCTRKMIRTLTFVRDPVGQAKAPFEEFQTSYRFETESDDPI